MEFTAGQEFKNDAHHAVLWTKASFTGDIKIEYDYTRTDEETSCVKILYTQAIGDGEDEFVKDISTWAKYREVLFMKKYFENMNALQISYAIFENAVNDTSFYVELIKCITITEGCIGLRHMYTCLAIYRIPLPTC